MREIFWEDFLGGFFWEDFWEECFGRNFLGGILCTLRIVIDLFVKILVFVKILSKSKEGNFRSLEVRVQAYRTKKNNDEAKK